MYCQLPKQNELCYNIIEFIKYNTRFINQNNEVLVKSVIDALCLEDQDAQARSLILFINAYSALFSEKKTEEEIEYFMENHKIFTIQVSALSAEKDLKKDCHFNDEVSRKTAIPKNNELFIFIGLPLFMKNGKIYGLDGSVMYDTKTLEYIRNELQEFFYVVGNIHGESYDLTD
jgi:hypothetical protein